MNELLIKISPVSLTTITYSIKDKGTVFTDSSNVTIDIFDYIKKLQNRKLIGSIDKISFYGNTAYIKGLIHKNTKFKKNSFSGIPIFIEGEKYEEGD